MAFRITENARLASLETNIQPNLVFEIDGVETLFGTVEIKKLLRYGDDFDYGDSGLVYGGSVPVNNQKPYVSFDKGTSTTISQKLDIDKGLGESVSSMTVALIDKNQEVSDLISPGNQLTDVIGRRVKLWYGPANVNWPEDYIIIFRGIINRVDAGAGLIKFDLSHPDQKKRKAVFAPATTDLTATIGTGVTAIDVGSTADFLLPIVGPSGAVDDDYRLYLRIDDECMEIVSKTATQFIVVRGELGTTPATHNAGAEVRSVYRLGESSNIDLALKFMLSGKNDNQFVNEPMTNFNYVSPTRSVANAIVISQLNSDQIYNIQVGDYITTTGALNAANNVTLQPVVGVEVNNSESIITIGGTASFVEEQNTTGTFSVRSQYDVWPTGLSMLPDEVDIQGHLDIKGRFIPDFTLDIRLQDEIDGLEFISAEFYNPASCFSIPTNARSGVGIHTPPLPDETIRSFDINNVLKPDRLKVSRSLKKNRTTTFIYKYDEDILEPDTFLGGVIARSPSAIAQAGDNDETQVIESRGMRTINSAESLATTATTRRLKKYQFGAEFIDGFTMHFRDSYMLEIGDIILVDFASLKLTDIQTGTRSGDARLMQIANIKKNLRDGGATASLVDTNFDKDSKFGLIGPASIIQTGVSDTQFIIQSSFASQFGANEFFKWNSELPAVVRVRAPDFSRVGVATLSSIGSNTVTVDASLGFTPQPGDIMEYAPYDQQTNVSVKTIFVHFSDDVNDFPDGAAYFGFF